jgi:pimeloyl-ACP methyl ester carboxylesterase
LGSNAAAALTPAPTARVSSTRARDVTTPTDPLAVYYGQTVAWTACNSGQQCAKIKVPLDWAAPAGAQISIALARIRAVTPSKRLGSLVINPGGPGGSGLELLDSIDSIFSARLMSRYDIVGFDPRGVGQSTPVKCVKTAKQMDKWVSTYHSATKKGRKAQTKQYKAFGKRCLELSGALLAHVDTASAARDMDVIRAVLGETKLHYLGYSYGTYLGTIYAELFPGNVGRIVLDGAVNPGLKESSTSLTQLRGFDKALRAYAKDCVKSKDCRAALGPKASDVLKQINKLIKRSRTRPLRGQDGRKLTEPLAVTAVIMPLYDEGLWGYLTIGLDMAVNGSDVSLLLALADLYNGRENGKYLSNETESNLAINCLDSPSKDAKLSQVKKLTKTMKRVSPTLGEFWVGSGVSVCAQWPVKAVGKPHKAKSATTAPILIVGTTGDPATPYKSAVSLSKQLKTSRLLTYKGDGHTAYGRSNSCITKAVDGFLVDGKLPKKGKKC